MITNQQCFHSNTILIVDPDLPTLNLYAGVLSRGYRVVTCSNPQQAMEILAGGKIRLLIVEPAILGYQRWDVLSEIIRLYPSIPVIVCSALDDRGVGMKSGIARFLIKPVLPLTLLEVTMNVLEPFGESPSTGGI